MGALFTLVYYQHLEDTDGETPFSFKETRALRTVQRWMGQIPKLPIVEVVHGQSDFC